MATLLDRIRWVTLIVTVWISYISAKEVRIVCYYTNWSVYRPGSAKFSPQNINPYLCTHLVYAFGGFTKENTLKPFDKYQDIEKGGYAKFVGLKTYNKNLKTLLAIGGWNEGSTRFSPMVANADRRKDLAKNVIKFLRQNHFDGLDLDWEYPSFRDGGKSRDKDNYAQLVQELREEFDRESEKTGRPRLLLTMAVPAGIEYVNKGYDIPKLTKYLDWMNILSYDYHSAYEPAVNHHSPLYPLEEESEYSYDIDLNVDYTIKHYLEAGAERSKLVLGIPTYGRSYTLYNEDANEVGAPADGPGEMGEATRENGYLAYYEICESIKSGGWIVESPYPDAMGPYAYKDNQWVGFDDEEIASKKAEYVAEHGLGGIMFWSIDNDDFRGNCGKRPYPIIEAAKEALLKAYGLTDAALIVTKKPIKSRTKTRGRTPKATTTTTEVLPTKSLNSGGRQSARRKINRVQDEDNKISHRRRRPTSKAHKRRILVPKVEDSATESSLVITPSYTTPEPPSTPNTGGDFKCEEEGFYPHPRDCKKYFWCLSGTADQIIAHQFTCPAGLYFNKAAASCDYSQNVLCNKKLSKTTTTTAASSTPDSTTSSTTTESVLSSRRPLPKITAATSRTTFTTTTAAPEYEDEYEEYEDEEDVPNGDNKQFDSEEDPRVIKELIELIKKAGGIEELEKQLKFQDDGSATIVNSGSTTPSTISKSLYQRVLAKTASKDNKFNKAGRNTLTYNILNRNSRGPQNEGLEQNKDEPASVIRSRPQYSSIQRQRPSTESTPTNEEDPEKVESETAEETPQNEQPLENSGRSFYKNSQPEYVTIRRQRISTTTESPKEQESFNYKRLGETIQDDSSKEEVEEEEEEKKIRNSFRSTTVATTYVTIRRTRPTTTSKDKEEEESTEGKILTRPVGQSHNESDATSPPEYLSNQKTRPVDLSSPTTSKYVEIRRPTTTESPSTTTQDNSILPEAQGTSINVNRSVVDKLDDETNTQSPEENTVGKLNLGVDGTGKPVDGNEDPSSQSIIDRVKELIKPSTERVNTEAPREKKKPQLYEPRPFSINTRTRPTTTELPTSQPEVKVSPPSSTRKAFRKKADSLNIAKLNNQENNINNVNSNIKNRFSESVSAKEEEEETEEQEGRSRLRGRGSSRFKLENVVTTTGRSRPRIRLTTEENDSDYETTENVRKFRPDISSEIADLSSLTAVDLNEFGNRRRRPTSRRLSPARPSPETTTTVTTTTTTTTKKPEESLKTSSRTLPLARKFLSNAAFGKSRRVIKPALNESKTENQSNKINLKLRPVNNQSDVNSEASTNSNIITENDTKLLRFRKYGAASTTVETVVSKENRPSTLRPIRRIIRRFRTTTTTTTTASPTSTASSTSQPTSTGRSISQPTSTASSTSQSTTTTKTAEETQNVTNIEENLNYNIISKSDTLEENKNLTTESPLKDSNVKNSTEVANNTNIEENLTEPRARNSVLEVVDADEDDDELKSSEEDDEDENIKLSESNIRENSQISNFPNGNIVQELKPGRKFFRPIYGGLSKNDDDLDRPIIRRPVTEPSIIIRTRKIIRKLRPSPTPEVQSETPKIIKRLRPTTVAREESSTPKQFNGRRRFGYFRSTTTSTTTEKPSKSGDVEPEVEPKVVKPAFGKRKFGISNLRNLAEKSNDKSESTSQFSLNKSIYNRRKFFGSSSSTTTSTTTQVIPEASETTESPKEATTLEVEASTNTVNDTNGTTQTTSFNENKLLSTTELPTSTSDYEIGLTSTETTTYEIETNAVDTSTTETVQNEETTQDKETTQNESTSENIQDDVSLGTTQNGDTSGNDQDEDTSRSLLNNEATPEYIQGEITSESILNKDNFKQFIYGEFKSNQTNLNSYLSEKTIADSKDRLKFDEDQYGLTQNTTEELPITENQSETEENTLTTTLTEKQTTDENTEKNASETTTQRKVTTESALSSLFKRRRLEFSRNKTESINSIKLKQNNLSSKFRFNTNERRKELKTEITNFEHVEDVSEPKISETTDYKDNIIYEEPTTYATEEGNTVTTYNTDASITTTENDDVQTTEAFLNQNDNETELSTLIIDAETTSDYSVTAEDLLLTTSTSSTFLEERSTEEENSSTDVSSTTAATLTTEETSKLDSNETTITTNEYTTTTTRKPNRIFRPIASRPKFTFRQRTTENTSPDSISSTATTSERAYKSSRRYNQLGNRFTSTSTEKYDQNEELGYGSVKPFKPRLRFSTPNADDKSEEDEVEEEDQDKQVEEDNFEEERPERTYFGRDNQRPNVQFGRSYIRKGFKPQNIDEEEEEEEPIKDDDFEEEVISRPKYAEEEVISRPKYAEEETIPKVIDRPKYTPEDTEEEQDEEEEEDEESIPKVINRSKYTPKPVNYFTQKASTRRTFRKFTSTTPSVLAQNLTDIDVAAISLRNKNLFNKTRKMNTPFAGVAHTSEPTVKEEINLELNETETSSNNDTTSSSSSPPEILFTSSEAPTSTTEFASYAVTEQAKITEVTDKPTTLLHVFAQTESSIQETTTVSNETVDDIENNRKLEKLIEVNRFIKVSAKEDKVKSGSGIVESKTTLETMPKLDRIGLINRLTVIKVVNGLNTSTLDSLEHNKPDSPDHRNDRKLDLYEGLNIQVDPDSKTQPINLIHIDSKSAITKITPKPFYKIETSTIPLEGLFQTDSPLRYHNTYRSDSLNELLEGENSNYVNVRILEQDPSRSNRIRLDDRAKFIPVRILKDEEEVTMKADVVEVTPVNSKDQIKIVPIAVSFQKKIP